MTAEEDALRQLFQEVAVPPEVDRWPNRVRRPHRPPVRTRRLVPALAGLLIGGVMLTTAIIATPNQPQPPLGATSSPGDPSPAISIEPSPTGPTPSPTNSKSPTTSRTSTPPGWPTASTTGVPAGTSLRTHAGDLRIDKAGQVVSDLLVTGTITVAAPNVTIRRTKIVAGGQFTIRQLPEATNLVIEDSEVSGKSGADVQYGIVQGANGLEVRRCHIHGVQQGIEAGSAARITDSLIDNLVQSTSTTGIATRGGTGLTIRHSVVLNQTSGGTAIAVYADNGPQRSIVIDSSLLGGGRYTLHVGVGVTDITVTDNRFTRTAKAAPFRWDTAPPGDRWTGNAWQDNETRLDPPT